MSATEHIDKLDALFKEEMWGRLVPSGVGISRFKILDEFITTVVNEKNYQEIHSYSKEHLQKQDSLSASYISGVIAFHFSITEERKLLLELLKIFSQLGKWAVVEHIAEKILEYGENLAALKALSESLEKLKRRKEAIPVWEELLKINRYEAEIARKLSNALAEEDQEKSAYYLKLALEGYIKKGAFESVGDIMQALLDRIWSDRSYIERIERMLSDAKQKELVYKLLHAVYDKVRDADADYSLELLKKLAVTRPSDSELRKRLVKALLEQYAEHSQAKRFIELSKLANTMQNPASAIAFFEKNIVLDTGNYVHHRSWGLGKISAIDGDDIFIDFAEKQDHKMSVNMALQSLTPLSADHLFVLQHNDFEGMKKLFSENYISFFKIHIRSYGGEIQVNDLKRDLIPSYIDAAGWTKWWNRVRVQLKKDPEIGFSQTKKDHIFLRDKPVTLSEELLYRFTRAEGFSAKLNLAEELANNVSPSEAGDSAKEMADYFRKTAETNPGTKLVLSYFVLESFIQKRLVDINLGDIRKNVEDYIRECRELPILSMKISSYDNKKELVNLIRELRSDWVSIFCDILFERPVRIHRYIFSLLVMEKNYQQINSFIERITLAAKDRPEVFLWTAKSLLLKTWEYSWLEYSEESIVLTLFRTAAVLVRSDVSGRAKGSYLEFLTENDFAFIRSLIEVQSLEIIGRVYDICHSSELLGDVSVEKIRQVIVARFPDFQPVSSAKSDEGISSETILVTKKGLASRQEELSRVINIELVQLTKDLTASADITGDLRENFDYTALLEKQSVLKQTASRLDSELKQVQLIDFDRVDASVVSIGTEVSMKTAAGREVKFAVLGPWDADFEKGILSYRSDIARKLLGKKKGDELDLRIDVQEEKFTITSIVVYQE